jgi:hypothetical protein
MAMKAVHRMLLFCFGASLGWGGFLGLLAADAGADARGPDLRWAVPLLLGGGLGAHNPWEALGGAVTLLAFTLLYGISAALVLPVYFLSALTGWTLRGPVWKQRRQGEAI